MNQTMRQITWDKDGYTIDGQPGFLISGEFQYFRVPKENWSYRLDLLIEAGGNCVATYIPWILHEPTEGDFKLGDQPYRDLEGFLDLCKDKGLPVVCRPGPYQYSEMKYCGLPGWLCEGYPQILARNKDGGIMTNSSVSYLHPVFLEKTKKWFDFICPVIARHTAEKGGPVIFVQFDNELTGIHEWFGGWDYSPEGMGIGGEDGRYARFLRKKYGDICALNEAYAAVYSSFADVNPAGDQTELVAKDYRDFSLSAIAEYAVILAGWMREHGIDCDLMHNAANPDMNPYFLETKAALGDRFLLGSDLYYNLNMDWESDSPAPKRLLKSIYCHDELKLMGYPSTILEMQAGSASEWPPILPEDLKCWYMANIALGMKGLNYYVFTGGPNPEDIGGDGAIYDYGAGIAADNTVRPIYHMQKEFGAFLHDNAWLSRSERVSDYYLGLNWEYARAKGDAWEFMQKGFMITSLCSSLMPEFADVSCDNLIGKNDKPLVVVCSDSMGEGMQRRLVEYVKGGGTLLLLPVIPTQDENFAPCAILSDFLGGRAERLKMTGADVRVGDVCGVYNNALWQCAPPESAVPFAAEEKSGTVLGWKRDYPGGGTAAWLGLRWRHDKLILNRMMRELFGVLGIEGAAVECDNPNLWVALRGDEQKRMLFLMNLFSSPLEAGVRVRQADGGYADFGRIAVGPMEVMTIKV